MMKKTKLFGISVLDSRPLYAALSELLYVV